VRQIRQSAVACEDYDQPKEVDPRRGIDPRAQQFKERKA
jgi:hypothetical protein